MADLYEIIEYLDSTIMIDQVNSDPSNNGLQVEGTIEVNKIAFCVDTSETLIHKAIETGADLIFVHHGLSWGSSLKYITDYNANLLKPLIKNDISLYAAHLPLDGHPEFGHNVLLADLLKLQKKEPFSIYNGTSIGVKGILSTESTPVKISKHLVQELDSIINSYSSLTVESELKNSCTIIGKENDIKSIGIVSGSGGMDCVHDAINEDLDCVITGEIGHGMYHLAKENGITVITPGHYRTEVPGVVAVMDLLKEHFDVETEFINIPTGL
jgi:dinuclear metal center YbgI/SA1388 family protein